jgi:hypothetical protein
MSYEEVKKMEKKKSLEPLFYVDLVKTKEDDFGFSTHP